MMYHIDLLKGQGLPHRSSPKKVAVRILPYLIPLFLASLLYMRYRYNSEVLSMANANISRMEDKIDEQASLFTEHKVYLKNKNYKESCLREMEDTLGQYTSWSDTLRIISECLPDNLTIEQLRGNSEIITRTMAIDQDNDEEDTIRFLHTELHMTIYGALSPATDQSVERYRDQLINTLDFGELIDQIHIQVRQDDIINEQSKSTYEIICRFKERQLP